MPRTRRKSRAFPAQPFPGRRGGATRPVVAHPASSAVPFPATPTAASSGKSKTTNRMRQKGRSHAAHRRRCTRFGRFPGTPKRSYRNAAVPTIMGTFVLFETYETYIDL